jgi:hypothetical protein
MVKATEPVSKGRDSETSESGFTLEPTRQCLRDEYLAGVLVVTHRQTGRWQVPKPVLLLGTERGNPVSLLARGQQIARSAYGGAGLGCRKKRMPCCNGGDTGCNITRHESEPTSDWSYIAREFGEPLV